MSLIEIIVISVGLAMDAFAVSVCKGLSIKKIRVIDSLKIAFFFGFFQGFMPFLGFFLGSSFSSLVSKIDHYLVFIILSIIGINMIKESFGEEKSDSKIDILTLLVLAIATSIDALAIGVSFAFLEVNLLVAVFMIGVITFIISFIGVYIGKKFGNKLGGKAEILGGIILIIIGIKILLEHLGIL